MPLKDAPTEEDVFNQVTQNLMLHTSVKFVGKSQLLEIEVELPDPVLAAAAANALAQGFTDSQLDTSEKSSQTTTAWMNTRLVKLRDNLRVAEKGCRATGKSKVWSTLAGWLPSAPTNWK